MTGSSVHCWNISLNTCIWSKCSTFLCVYWSLVDKLYHKSRIWLFILAVSVFTYYIWKVNLHHAETQANDKIPTLFFYPAPTIFNRTVEIFILWSYKYSPFSSVHVHFLPSFSCQINLISWPWGEGSNSTSLTHLKHMKRLKKGRVLMLAVIAAL